MSQHGEIEYEVLEGPLEHLSCSEQEALQEGLCALGRFCLDPLPDYQVFSAAPSCFSDKILVTARREPSDDDTPGQLVGFTSAVRLDVPGVDGPVLHTGLTIIDPTARRGPIMTSMFARLFLHMLAQFGRGLWLTNIAEVPSSLAHIAIYCIDVFPAPPVLKCATTSGKATTPSDTHMKIARHIANTPSMRSKMAVSPEASFDESNFVFRGSNGEDSCFRKDVDDPQYWHRDKELNDFYRGLFRRNRGDEVLQVAFLCPTHIVATAQKSRWSGIKPQADKLSRL